jgi:hypothetical protein
MATQTQTFQLAPTFKPSERCDRCGAQAYVRATLKGGGSLLFCAHHGREHLPKLRAIGTIIQDETDRLEQQPVKPSRKH